MNSLRKPLSWQKVSTNVAIRWQSSASSTTEIQIPERIERSSTDILKALSRTVPPQRNVPLYDSQCDSFLRPVTYKHWREITLSKDAGRRTALWMKSKHQKFFPKYLSEPAVPLFHAWPEHNDYMKMTDNDMKKLISESRSREAIRLCYVLGPKKVSTETKQSLLELLCFYNGQNTYPKIEYLHQKWYERGDGNETSTFRYTRFMQRLFTFLISQDEKTVSRAYSALICGSSHHNNKQLAYDLYQTCSKEKIPLSRDAYNSIIAVIPYLKRNSTMVITEIQTVCAEMVANGVDANIHTYNAILSSIRQKLGTNICIVIAKSVYNDIRKQGLECTLATYTNLLLIFMRNLGECVNEIGEVITAAATKTEYSISHVDDCMFFSLAMKLCCKVLADRKLGNLLHETLMTGDNYKFLNTFYESAFYYRHYLILMLENTSFEQFDQIYDTIVPYVYQPEKQLFEHIIEVLQLQPSSVANKYIVKYWNDLLTFFPSYSPTTSARMMFLMCNKCELPDDSPLHDEFGNAAWTLWKIMQAPDDRFSVKRSVHDAEPLANIAILLLRAKRYNDAIEVMTYVNHPGATIQGVMLPGVIQQIFTISLAEANSQIVFLILEYVMKHDLPGLHQMVKKARAQLSLTSKETAKLNQMVDPYLDPITAKMLEDKKEDTSVKDTENM